MLFQTMLLVAGAAAVAGLARRLGLVRTAAAGGRRAGRLVRPRRSGSTSSRPEVVLYLILPPLLFAAAWQSSVINFRQNLRAIGLLSVGLVLFTTAAVGLAVYAVVPDMPLAAAFALGAIVSPPDAVAATAVGRTVGLPRRLMMILAGESLINDATALTAYRVAVASAGVAGFSVLKGFGEFLAAAVGGVVVGYLLARARRAAAEAPARPGAGEQRWCCSPRSSATPSPSRSAGTTTTARACSRSWWPGSTSGTTRRAGRPPRPGCRAPRCGGSSSSCWSRWSSR